MAFPKIEKNVPITSRTVSGGMSQLLSQMEIGDSVVLTQKQANAIRSACVKSGAKVVTRKLREGNFRVWRSA